MTSLKIPQLTLFHSRKKERIYPTERLPSQRNYRVCDQRLPAELSALDINIPTRQYSSVYPQSLSLNHMPSRYKEIADHYLERKIPLDIYPDLTPYVEPLTFYPRSLSRQKYQLISKRCYCEEDQKPTQLQYQKQRYLKEKNFMETLSEKSQKLTKDPYLADTLRNVSKVPSSPIKTTNKNKQPIKISLENSQPISVKKPSQKQVNIQTEEPNKKQNASMANLIEKVVKKAPQILDKRRFQKKMSQTLKRIGCLEQELEDQEYQIDFSDLELAKEQYFEKSKRLFEKLIQLSTSQQKPSFPLQFFVEKKITQINWPEK